VASFDLYSFGLKVTLLTPFKVRILEWMIM